MPRYDPLGEFELGLGSDSWRGNNVETVGVQK